MAKSTYDLIKGGDMITARNIRLAFDEKEWIDNKVKTLTNSDDDYPTTSLLTTELNKITTKLDNFKTNFDNFTTEIDNLKEDKANKKTTLTNNDTDYPTTKLLETELNKKQNTLSAATQSTLGLVRLTSNTALTQAPQTLTETASRTYAIQKNSNNQLVVNVPWTDTTYSASTGLSLSGTTFSINTASNITISGVWNVPTPSMPS